MNSPDEPRRNAVLRALQRRLVTAARCARACFLGPDGLPSWEGRRVLADLREFARLETHSFLRDGEQRLDPLAMARIEGRREVVRRLQQQLRLDEFQLSSMTEKNDA